MSEEFMKIHYDAALEESRDLFKISPYEFPGKKVIAFSPLLFLAWDYYNTGSFIHSCITCCRDFAWPAAVVVA